MRRSFMACLSTAFVLVIASQAFAQKGGGGVGGQGGGGGGAPGGGAGGFGGGKERGASVLWLDSMDMITKFGGEAAPEGKRPGREAAQRRFVFVYVRPVNEGTEPNAFNNMDLVTASYGQWAFVRMDLDRDNAWQKTWGIKTAPAVLGCDIHGNKFMQPGSIAIDAMRAIVKSTPDLVAQYKMKLESDYARANDALKTDETKASKLFVDIVLSGKVGYKDVEDSTAKLALLAETAFKKCDVAESASVESGIEYLESLVKLYKTTPPGVEAEIRIARLEHGRGNVQIAVLRLLKVLKYDARLLAKELESAAKLMADISAEGDQKITVALAADKAAAKEVLRKLAREYAGTDAGKRAVVEGK